MDRKIKKKEEEGDNRPWVIMVFQLDLERTQCLRKLSPSSNGSGRRDSVGLSYLSSCQFQLVRLDLGNPFLPSSKQGKSEAELVATGKRAERPTHPRAFSLLKKMMNW